MDKQTLLARIDGETSILSLPQVLSEMLQAMDDPDFSAERLSEIILKDPGLTSRILQLANSPFYRHVSEISTVNQAVQMLGMTTVRCLALSASIFNIERFEKGSGLNVKDFFTTVMTIGAASQRIAAMKKYPAAEEALVTGLLHEIGTMYLVHHYPDLYREVLEAAPLPELIIEEERKAFGIDHCEIGYYLARKWSLPDGICEAIRDHRTKPERPGNRLTDIVRLAYLLTHNIIEGGVEKKSNPFEQAYAAGALLELSKEKVDDIVAKMPAWTLSIAEFLGVDIGDIQEMLVRANRRLWQVYLLVDSLFREREELSQKLLEQERIQAAIKARDIAHATLSHYLNNAIMAVYGRSQIMRNKLAKGKHDEIIEKLPHALDIIDRAVKKISAVVGELKGLSLSDDLDFIHTSKAVNIDDRIKQRLEQMEKDSGLVLPEETEEVLAQY